jgi:hypothetical protein
MDTAVVIGDRPGTLADERSFRLRQHPEHLVRTDRIQQVNQG